MVPLRRLKIQMLTATVTEKFILTLGNVKSPTTMIHQSLRYRNLLIASVGSLMVVSTPHLEHNFLAEALHFLAILPLLNCLLLLGNSLTLSPENSLPEVASSIALDKLLDSTMFLTFSADAGFTLTGSGSDLTCTPLVERIKGTNTSCLVWLMTITIRIAQQKARKQSSLTVLPVISFRITFIQTQFLTQLYQHQ